MLVTLYWNGQSVISLDWHEQFHVKAYKERFHAAGSRCCQSLKFEDFRTLSNNYRIYPCISRIRSKAAPRVWEKIFRKKSFLSKIKIHKHWINATYLFTLFRYFLQLWSKILSPIRVFNNLITVTSKVLTYLQ